MQVAWDGWDFNGKKKHYNLQTRDRDRRLQNYNPGSLEKFTFLNINRNSEKKANFKGQEETGL